MTGNFSIGTFWIRTESYDDIKIALKEICGELKDLESVNIDEQKFTLEFYLGGDLKFIALVLGNFLYVSCLKLLHFVFYNFYIH